jgi:hypothetical protein
MYICILGCVEDMSDLTSTYFSEMYICLLVLVKRSLLQYYRTELSAITEFGTP